MRGHFLLDIQLPHTFKRLDCLVTGYDKNKDPIAKLWTQASPATLKVLL